VANGALLYNRFIRVQVFDIGGVGRTFSNLRIAFDVKKTSESNTNTTTIKIYNLNPESRAFLEQTDLSVILEVGYQAFESEPIIEILSTGNLLRGKVKHEREAGDWVTSLEYGDGETPLQESFYNRSFVAGASLRSIIQDVARTLGLPVNTIIGLQDRTLNSSAVFSGSSKEILDRITRDAGVEWSIQDGEVVILPPAGFTLEEVIVLNENTGLIGSPIRRKTGIEFTALLNPRIRSGRRVRITSRDVTGEYRVRKVEFEGDNLEGKWNAMCEAL